MVENRHIAAVLAVFCVAGCVTTAEVDTSREQWGDCIAGAVARVDDGRTDPASVAYGVAPMCATQYAALTNAFVQKSAITTEGQDFYRQRMRADEIRLITSAILIRRSKKN